MKISLGRLKRVSTDYTLILAIFIFVMFFINSLELEAHEETHAAIFRGFGFTPEISYDYFAMNGVTYAKNPNNITLTDNEYRDLRYLQLETEIYGYQQKVLVNAILYSVFLLIIGFAWILQQHRNFQTNQPKRG